MTAKLENKTKFHEQKRTGYKILLVALILIGAMATWFTLNLTSRKLSESALEKARIVAQSINLKRVQSLSGNKTDLLAPDYLRIKEQLTQINQSLTTCRFLYLMGRKSDGTVFFFMDSQKPNSKDYAHPGLVYDEVPNEYLYTFNTGKPQTVGPVKDRWGVLITSLIPLYNPNTKELIAVLGMDVDADDWNRIIILQSMLPISLTLLILLLILYLYMLNKNRQMVKLQYAEKKTLALELQNTLKHVKQLQGILPMCANCKSIRDNKGYWNQIESYLCDHSEAILSHGLCEKCAEDLYGEATWYQKNKEDA